MNIWLELRAYSAFSMEKGAERTQIGSNTKENKEINT